jgi:hypothetical protein
MARVIVPQNARRYDPNARGAVTTFVTMRSNNPFENERAQITTPALANRGRVMLAGLGEEAIDWAKLVTQVGTGVAQTLLPQPPAAAAPRVIVQPAPGMSSTTKVLIFGSVAAVGVLALVLMMKKS